MKSRNILLPRGQLLHFVVPCATLQSPRRRRAHREDRPARQRRRRWIGWCETPKHDQTPLHYEALPTPPADLDTADDGRDDGGRGEVRDRLSHVHCIVSPFLF